MNEFDYLSNRHALLGLKNKNEIEDYDYYLYQEYQKQEQERMKRHEEFKKEHEDQINYDLVFNMEQPTNTMNYTSSAINPFLIIPTMMDNQQQQQENMVEERHLPFNLAGTFDDGSKLEYRKAPSNTINEEFILNNQSNQQSHQVYAGNALLLGEQATQALELLNLTTFTVNNWSENMRKWMIHRVLIPTMKEIDSINLQMHKTIQFNCDFKGYDAFNPLDISPEYQHSIPNSIPHTEDTSKFTLKYVLATLVTQIDQQQQQQPTSGFTSGFGFSNGFNNQPANNPNQKNVEFGNLLRRRLRLERYLSIPNLNLFDSTDKIACRKYVIDRVRAMSKGQFEKSSTSRPHSEQYLYEQDIYPTDEEILVNLFCKFMDFVLDSHGHSSQFSNKHYCDQTVDKKENPHSLYRNRAMLAPGVANAMKKKRGLDKQAPIKKGLYLCKSKVSISHYNIEDDGSLYECQPGRNNVFYAFVIFLHLINTKYDGYIDTVALSDLNLSQVIESY